MSKTDLSTYNNYPYHPGGSAAKRIVWYYVNAFFLKTSLIPSSKFKVTLLRLFGARIGKKVTIKPCINVKYPWNLSIGDASWVGENVWIDSLVQITIGANVCLSQGAVLLTGSHDYKRSSFDLITKGIILEDGVWIGAGAMVNLGITAASHAVLTSGSIATKNLEAYSVYQGNPAVKIRERKIETT
ncbi:WcaF family extracellular polysaccharide biosynthesis acetyltransferase [Mucilaginibacter sp. CAU 1740]|uniref:WcaF family extracellular polysaccharide biosynthesis acetyltransferase n=1 Tax=Mucilaginibacter sp. CAU 1740 TaxID=3140365 RepID=UPI00325B749E